ncbi:RNA polymerase sigma factor [Amycolatopsis sp. NPDC101161]|uniref:RNA polymerase sigma factor n=1 Tax=Amycolatopsis sp. NPDC101161 TaxID=3363940 RepID=UPI0037F3D2C9
MTDGPGEADRALAERAMSLRKLYDVELVMRPLKRPGQDPVRNESARLYRTVRHMVMSARRHQRRFDNADIDQFGDRLCQTTWASPDLHLEVVETLHAIRALPEDQAHAVALALAGHSREAIAEILGISLSAAKQRVSRGRRRLLAKLEGRDR